MNTAQRVQDLINFFVSADLFKKQVTVARELRDCGLRGRQLVKNRHLGFAQAC